MPFIIINILFLITIPIPIYADIFKCIKKDGSVYYYDRNCPNSDKAQEFTKRDLLLMRFELQQKHGEIIKQKRQEQLQEIATQKQQVADERKRLRLEAKCETVRQQIDLLNKQYKQGYTLKQGQILDRKLAECNNKRRMYCKNE